MKLLTSPLKINVNLGKLGKKKKIMIFYPQTNEISNDRKIKWYQKMWQPKAQPCQKIFIS